MIQLYDFTRSGNCYKARLLLSLLGLEHELVPVELLADEHKSAQFLQLNPLGQVPVLIDGSHIIPDSQAILVYLARSYGGEDWLPLEAGSMSLIVRWLSVAANDIRNSIAAIRLHFLFKSPIDLELTQKRADALLKTIDKHLSERKWLELERPTIADIACFPYIALAPEAKIALEPYPHIVSWIDRIKQLPDFVGMPGI